MLFGTSLLFTMHQPGLPGIRYSFPVEYSSANSFRSSLHFLSAGSMISLSKMFSSHSSLTPIVAFGFSFFFTQSPTLYNPRTVRKPQKQIWNSPSVAAASTDLSFSICICRKSSRKASTLSFSTYIPVPDPVRMCC